MEARGVISGCRRSGAKQDTRHVIIRVEDADPGSLIGRWIEVTIKGKVYRGRVLRAHGRHAVMARFRRNLPGQALGSVVALRAR